MSSESERDEVTSASTEVGHPQRLRTMRERDVDLLRVDVDGALIRTDMLFELIQRECESICSFHVAGDRGWPISPFWNRATSRLCRASQQ